MNIISKCSFLKELDIRRNTISSSLCYPNLYSSLPPLRFLSKLTLFGHGMDEKDFELFCQYSQIEELCLLNRSLERKKKYSNYYLDNTYEDRYPFHFLTKLKNLKKLKIGNGIVTNYEYPVMNKEDIQHFYSCLNLTHLQIDHYILEEDICYHASKKSPSLKYIYLNDCLVVQNPSSCFNVQEKRLETSKFYF